MGIAIIKIKMMPDSPSTNLNEVEEKAKKIIINEKGDRIRIEREPIAFGLTAINILFTREETLDSDELVKKLQEIKNVSSAEIVDFRRALG